MQTFQPDLFTPALGTIDLCHFSSLSESLTLAKRNGEGGGGGGGARDQFEKKEKGLLALFSCRLFEWTGKIW